MLAAVVGCGVLGTADRAIATTDVADGSALDREERTLSFERISPEEAQGLMEEGHVYLDVRTEEEFAGGRVPGSVNIPVFTRGPMGMQPNPSFLEQVNTRFPKDSALITACLRGGRSMRAAQMLVDDGYTQVVDMRGGYDAELDPGGNVSYPGWARRGLPTESD